MMAAVDQGYAPMGGGRGAPAKGRSDTLSLKWVFASNNQAGRDIRKTPDRARINFHNLNFDFVVERESPKRDANYARQTFHNEIFVYFASLKGISIEIIVILLYMQIWCPSFRMLFTSIKITNDIHLNYGLVFHMLYIITDFPTEKAFG